MLFCIIGKSSTGKDTIFKELLNNKELDLKNVVTYTTRPIRANEIEGAEYHFVNQETKGKLLDSGKVIEIRTYNTYHGPWDYFTVDDASTDIKNKNYILIATLESFQKIKDYYGKDYVLPIYIEVEDGLRLSRALSRERAQNQPKYSEMCRRFLADCEDFSEEKLREAGINKRFYNETMEQCAREIGEYINGNKS